MKTWIDIDNGVTGTIGIINDVGSVKCYQTPVERRLDYTKKAKWLNRLDACTFYFILQDCVGAELGGQRIVVIERPMVNPQRWNASLSAIRCLEAQLTLLELMSIQYRFIDSREWQRGLLPSGLEKEDLKRASLEVGKRLFPQVDFTGFHDADGLLIAEWARRTVVTS